MNLATPMTLLSGISFDGAATAIPDHYLGRWRGLTVKNVVPMGGEHDIVIDQNSITWFDTNNQEFMKYNASFEDGSLIIEDGLSRTPVGMH